MGRMHIGRPVAPHDVWQQWPAPEPLTIALAVSIAAIGACYACGVASLWRRAGRGRGIARWRASCFAGGLSVLLAASLSPLDAAAASLFAAHMVQHLLVIMVAAPLLLLGNAPIAFVWAWPLRARRAGASWWHTQRHHPFAVASVVRALTRILTSPLVAVVLHTATIWIWHVPRLYDAAVQQPVLHALEHASFLATALLFWYTVIDRHAVRRRGVPVAVMSLFVVALQCVVLGALLAMARHPWYASHLATSAPWGLLPLEDQQLAGLIMWIPTGLVYLGAMAALVVPALTGAFARRTQHRMARGETRALPH